MIRFFHQRRDGRVVVGLGLSRENTERLLEGQAIHVPFDEPPPQGFGLAQPIDLVLVGGESEQAIGEEIDRTISTVGWPPPRGTA